MSKEAGIAREETLDLAGQKALASVLRGLGNRELALKIGRYEIGEVLGQGACGQVVAARDPELDREVAIKIVLSHRERPDPAAEARLMREAEALARLQHPHVVPVYDVGLDAIGAGTGARARRGVYVVMARLRGRSLYDRLRDGSLSRGDVIDAFLQAASGLEAAHEVGVVHRDFKPANAMMTDDGMVVVIDFGLARALDESGPSHTDRGETRTTQDASQSFTATGTVMGTPRYMAPEQHTARPAKPAADQYAWCVALWEALAGEPPFEGDTIADLARAKQHGRLPRARAIPAALRPVLARGLRPDPHERWPSMRALRDAVRTAVARRRRRIAAASLAAVSLGGAAAWGTIALDHERRREQCRAEAASIVDVWNDERAESLASAFAGTELPYATDAWTRSRARFEAYVGEWSAARRSTCEAADVERTLAPDVAMASRACLDEHRARLDALLLELSSPDVVAVNRAAAASASLPRVATCSAPTALREWTELPSDPEERTHMAELRSRLVESTAARATGRYDRALAIAQAVAAEADELGWASLSAEANIAAADAYDSLGKPEDACRVAEAAFFQADATGRDDLALRAASALVFFFGNELGRMDDALEWGRFAQIRADRADADDLDVARMLSNLGSVQRVRGEQEEARALHERALALYEKTLGPDHPEVAVALNNLGAVAHDRGRFDEAVAYLQRAVEIDVATRGPDHPSVAHALNNLGVVQQRRGDLAKALELHERALGIRERALGPEHPDVAVSLNNLGALRRSKGEPARALELYTRALAIRERVGGPDHPLVAATLDNLGMVQRDLGKLDLALELHGRALSGREESLGPDHPDVATSLFHLGEVHHQMGEHARALELYTRARDIWQAKYAPDHPSLAAVREHLAEVQRDMNADAPAAIAD